MLSAVYLIEFDFLVFWYQIVHVYAAMKLQVHQQIIHVGQIQLVLFLFDRLVKEIDSIFHMSLFSCCSLYPIAHTSSHFQFCVVSGRFLSKNDFLHSHLFSRRSRFICYFVFHVYWCPTQFHPPPPVLMFVLLVHVMSVFLRFTASDYHFGIFKLFLQYRMMFEISVVNVLIVTVYIYTLGICYNPEITSGRLILLIFSMNFLTYCLY